MIIHPHYRRLENRGEKEKPLTVYHPRIAINLQGPFLLSSPEPRPRRVMAQPDFLTSHQLASPQFPRWLRARAPPRGTPRVLGDWHVWGGQHFCQLPGGCGGRPVTPPRRADWGRRKSWLRPSAPGTGPHSCESAERSLRDPSCSETAQGPAASQTDPRSWCGLQGSHSWAPASLFAFLLCSSE